MRGFWAFSAVMAWTIVCAGQAATQPAAFDQAIGTGKVVGEDYFYNHQEKNGKQYHYIWDDTAASGYSKFGDVFKQYGATLASLDHAPTRADLDKFSVYVIVNPSIPKTAAGGTPNYMNDADADVIAGWVSDGGVLAMFANDKLNTELEHYSILAKRFGITFNVDRRNEVPNARDRSPGTFRDLPDHPIFAGVSMIYMKEICTLQVQPPAQAILVVDNEQHTGKDNIIATAKFGKGTVFAVGDPWVYNEYIDVKSTPGLTLDNRKAAENLAGWLLSAASPPAAK
jgi:unsaturated rhamnogalacturonyl hydrolase